MSNFLRGGVRVLGSDIRTGTLPQLGTSNWWKVARSAGVYNRQGQQGGKIDLFMNINIWIRHLRQGGRTPLPPRQVQPCCKVSVICDWPFEGAYDNTMPSDTVDDDMPLDQTSVDFWQPTTAENLAPESADHKSQPQQLMRKETTSTQLKKAGNSRQRR